MHLLLALCLMAFGHVQGISYKQALPLPPQVGLVVVFKGYVPPDAERFTVGLRCGGGWWSDTSIALQISVRFGSSNIVLRNTFQGGSWDSNERDGGFPLTRGQDVELTILLTQDSFKLGFNGEHFCNFQYRMDKECVTHIAVEADVVIHCLSFQPPSQPLTLIALVGDVCTCSLCRRGGTCVPDFNDKFYCQCPADRTGDTCEEVSEAYFPQLKIYEGTAAMSTQHHFFNGLTVQQQGTLTGATIYARQAGTMWLDVWVKVTADSYLLVSSTRIEVTTTGPHSVDVSPVAVVPGHTVGVHSNSNGVNPLAVTVGAGYLVWRTSWLEDQGDFVVGTTTLTPSDNTDTVDTYMIPALQLHIEPNESVSWYPGCSAQQELEVISRPDSIGPYCQVFHGLTTKCSGRLSAISIHTKKGGTVYIDLWEKTASGTDSVLYFTKEITAIAAGKTTVYLDFADEFVIVRRGMIYGTHRPSGTSDHVLDNSVTSPDQQGYTTVVYDEQHGDVAWTPNVLHESQLSVRNPNYLRRPSIAIHISNQEDQECTKNSPSIPMIMGPTDPALGLTIFPSVSAPCTSRVRGLSFYTSAAGFFYAAMFEPLSDSGIYKHIFSSHVSVSEAGFQSFTLQETPYLPEGAVLGIFDDTLHTNNLRYVQNTALLAAAFGTTSDNLPEAKRFTLTVDDISTEGPGVLLNTSTSIDVHFPPLQLQLDHGTEYIREV